MYVKIIICKKYLHTEDLCKILLLENVNFFTSIDRRLKINLKQHHVYTILEKYVIGELFIHQYSNGVMWCKTHQIEPCIKLSYFLRSF